MKHTLVIFLMLLPLITFSQSILEKVSEQGCLCIEKNKKDTARITQEEIEICFLEQYEMYKFQIIEELKVDTNDIEQVTGIVQQ
ncbi:MAG: hypothetical protein AAF705_16770, partial [Bacteroidota bacterium]